MVFRRAFPLVGGGHINKYYKYYNVVVVAWLFKSTFIFCFSMTASSSVAFPASWKKARGEDYF